MVCKRAQLSFSTKTCNSADTSAVGLVAADPCGYELCCPVLRQQCRLHIGGSPGVCRSPRISLWRHLPKEIHSIPFTCHRNMRKKNRKGQNCHCLCVLLLLLYIVHCTYCTYCTGFRQGFSTPTLLTRRVRSSQVVATMPSSSAWAWRANARPWNDHNLSILVVRFTMEPLIEITN